jgi:methionine-rich copper-binding protein CopC
MNRTKAAALVALLALAAPSAALAHAKMTASKPADGSTVAAGTSEIELNFSKPLRLSMVHVRDASKHDIALKSALPATFGPAVKLNTEALTPGHYEVTWTAVAEDGHVMKGAFKFSVKVAKAVTSPTK